MVEVDFDYKYPNYLRQLKWSPSACPSSFQGNMSWEVVLARLRLGHTIGSHALRLAGLD